MGDLPSDITLSPGGGFLIEPTGSATILTPEMLSDEQRMMRDTAEDFMRREVEPRTAEIEQKKPGTMRALLEKAGEVGLLGHDVPEAYGGLGGDKTSSSLITEAVSRLGSFAVSYGAHVGIGTMPLVLFGTPEQRLHYLPSLASGARIAAYALTEPGSGSDALAAKTKAVLSADGKSWKLTGTKQYITNAGFADLFTVFAKVDGEKFTAFLVERGAPGLTIGPEEHKLGIRGSSTCALYLEDCTIPADSVLGTVGQGHKIAFNILNIGRWKLGVGAVGGAKYCLEIGVRYARDRKQFGKPIADFDLIRKKLGDIATQTFVAESMAFRTAGLLDARAHAVDPNDPAAQKKMIDGIEEHSIEASIIKVFGSEMLHASADETLQIFGGAGYIEDYPIERVSRDARINRIFEGTNEINRLLVPGTLLKRALQGRLGLMALVGQVQQELADPTKINRQVPPGPLGREQRQCNFAKRAVAYGASLGVQKYMQGISEKQELLGVLADCLIQIYAMDSAITRTVQLVRAKGEERSRIPIFMTQLFVAQSYESVFHHLREMLMWMSQDEEWGREIRDINSYYQLERVNTFSLRRKIALHVLESGGYAL
ncbi:MAG TPA: acyl-CoA dehydrogenase family protein [Polyangia bacterium]|jgi:alkylation response protein AidB-like acyl-CoA dehydrogenase|nr:acyl-CoA dehydrogenase family protein [Polyangia bacterium]